MMFIFLLIAMAFAQEPKVEKLVENKPRVKTIYKKDEKHKFSGAQLKGSLKKPELSYIYERKGIRQEKIINIPIHFNDEINNGTTQF